jgi:DNA-binding beta-propeller fold protein YncE
MLNSYAKLLVMSVLTVSAVAVNAQTVKGTVALPGSPIGVAVNPILNRVYAAVPAYANNGTNDILSVIDGKKDVDIKDIKIPPVAYAVAVDYVRSLVYVGGVNGATGVSQVAVVSALTNTVLTTVTVTTTQGNGVVALAVNPVTGTAYAANSSDDEVDAIKLTVSKKGVVSGAVTARISVGAAVVPSGVSVNFVSNTVYASLLNGTVDIISGKTNTITSTTVFGAQNQGIAVDNINGNVIVASQPANGALSSVGVLTSAGVVTATLGVGNTATGVDVDPLTHLAFVANAGDPSLSVITESNTTPPAVTATVSVDSLFVAVNPVTEKVYVTPASSATLLTVVTE